MNKFYLIFLLLVTNTVISQVLYVESFETNTNGVKYNTSIPEFIASNKTDFFTRTDGSDISPSYVVTGQDGDYYFAAMDIDGDGANLPVQLSTIPIDVTGLTEVDFSILLAEDDDGTSQSWDNNDYFHITYSIDGGAHQNLLWVENDGSTYNTAPLIDTDFDGVGDGAEITSVFTEFTRNITLSSGATSIQFFFEMSLDAGNEDIAFDNIIVSSPLTDPTIMTSASTVSGFLQFVGAPSTEQTVDVSGVNLTADVEIAVTGDYVISLTTGTGFVNAVTLPFGTGTIASTPVYIRLNGSAEANPSDGLLTITSTGATDVIVNLEGQIALPTPTITASKTSITGFSHFVGVPSVADSFNVEGFNLTADITVSAPTNFEVSSTLAGPYGPTVEIPFGSGTVASTKVYVRLDGQALNLTQAGDITISSAGAISLTITLAGETLDYVASTIGAVTGVDANGVGTSIDDYVTLTGVVHCEDFRNNGYDVALIDANNDGITMFKTSNVDNYNPTEGDKIIVKGRIQQYNGLMQISPDAIEIVATGQSLQTPTSVTDIDESTESQYIQLDYVTLVNGETEWAGNTNFSVTDGTKTFVVRVPNDSPLVGTQIPNGPLRIIGIGKQFDNSSPYDSGYQIFPCSVASACNIDVSISLNDATITATSTAPSLTYQWVNCADTSDIVGATNASFTATVSGDYAVIITDGPCVEMSVCVNVDIAGLLDNDFSGISVYPNPVKDVLNITNQKGAIESVEVVSTTGSVVYSLVTFSNNVAVNTAKLNSGIYFVNVKTSQGVKTYKVIK